MLLRISVILSVLAAFASCDNAKSTSAPAAEVVKQVVVAWEPPETLEQLVTDEPFGPPIEIAGTHRHPECWETFEEDGKPLDPFPYADPIVRAEHLASCGVEAMTQLDDGTAVIAWGASEQPGSRARDLRIAAWQPDGRLRWSIDLNRSRQAPNWVANFRRSFVTALPPKHICAGTLWEGDTQVVCVGLETGEPTWKGSLPFWSGMEPQAGEDGLVVADLSAITKRYPFSGAEMKHAKLEGLGGRAGYYATDGHHLYFAPSRIDAPPFIAYDLKTFEETWRTPLPASPTATFAHAFDAFDRVLVKIDEKVFALDTTTGKIVWGYDVGDDLPSVAADDRHIYILSRRPDLPNRLTALDPKSGERLWSTDTPSGTLRVIVVEGKLFIGSIRAVQHVTVPDVEAPAGEPADGR